MNLFHGAVDKLNTNLAIVGALSDLLDKPGGFTCDLQEVILIARQVLQALACMHKKRIVHADLKPDNILFFSNEDVAICDFGLAMELGAEAKQLNSYIVDINERFYIGQPTVIIFGSRMIYMSA